MPVVVVIVSRVVVSGVADRHKRRHRRAIARRTLKDDVLAARHVERLELGRRAELGIGFKDLLRLRRDARRVGFATCSLFCVCFSSNDAQKVCAKRRAEPTLALTGCRRRHTALGNRRDAADEAVGVRCRKADALRRTGTKLN